MVRATVTAKYPGAELVDADVGIASNIVQQILSAAVTAGAVVWTFTSTTGFEADMYLRVRSSTGFEVIRVVSVDSGTQITVLRAQDGTTAVGHAANTAAECVVIALGHNQVVAEVIALEDALIGGGFLHDILISSADATSGDQLKDSFGLVLQAHYWTGSSTTYKVLLWHDMTAVTPESFFKVDIGGTTRLALRASDGELSVDKIKALTTNNDLLVSYNGTGGIGIGGAATGAGRVELISPDGTDYFRVLNGGMEFFTASTSRIGIGDTEISVRGIALSLESDAAGTEQSNLTATAGVTTWLAASASVIRIQNDQANTAIEVLAGIDASINVRADGTGYARLLGSDDTDRVVMGTVDGWVQRNNTVLLHFADGALSVRNATPLVWYAGNGTDERFSLTSAGATQFTLTADVTAAFNFLNESGVPVLQVSTIEHPIINSNFKLRKNPAVGGTGSMTIGEIASFANTLRIGDATFYLQTPLEGALPFEIVGATFGTQLRVEDPIKGIQTDVITAVTSNAALNINRNGTGNIIVGDATYHMDVSSTSVLFRNNGANSLQLTGGEIRLNNSQPLVFFTDFGVTEQSRFTIAAGSTTWAAAASSNIFISIIAGSTIGLGVGNNFNYSINHTNTWAFTGTLRVATLQAQGTNTNFVVNFNGSGGIVLGNATPSSGQIRIQAVTNIGFICTTTQAIMSTASGNVVSVTGAITSILLGETRLRGPIVLYSDAGTTEEGRFTIAANSIILAAAGGASIAINNDQGQTAVMVDAGVNSATRIRSDGTGVVTIGEANDTDLLSISTTSILLARNSVNLLTIIDTEFAHTNLATAEVVFHNTTASERWRFSPTQLTGQLADPGDGLAAASASIVLVAKNDQSGGPAQADYDFLMQHVVSSGAGGATPVLDAVFKLVGTTGFTIRKRIGDTGDYAVPLVPNLDTTNIAAAVYPGAIVRDTFNQAGSGMFFSDGTNWYELDIID